MNEEISEISEISGFSKELKEGIKLEAKKLLDSSNLNTSDLLEAGISNLMFAAESFRRLGYDDTSDILFDVSLNAMSFMDKKEEELSLAGGESALKLKDEVYDSILADILK